MAISDGKIFELDLPAGRAIPLFRSPDTSQVGTFFVLSDGDVAPGKKRFSFRVDTIQQVAGLCVFYGDIRQAIGQEMAAYFDQAICVQRPVAHQADCRQEVFGPICVVCDFLIRFPEPWVTSFDMRLAIYAPFEKQADTDFCVIHELSRQVQTRQTIYQLLFCVSHDIQT